MKIAFNPSTVAALIAPPNNKDITFDLRGHNIFARGVKFCGTDTNTWRDIKINNVSIGSNILDLRNGSNTTLTNTNGVVTINSTWRPVVDNLTSDSTTSSLSANQGRVLAGLINTLSTNISNQYALRDGSNATGRWRGGLACFDVRGTNYAPSDLNMGLELLFLRNNTNNLKDGGEYNGVFSFRQWASGTDWSGGKAHQLSFTDNGNIWHRTSSGDDSWGAWKKLAYSTDIPSSLKNPYSLTTFGVVYDGSAAKVVTTSTFISQVTEGTSTITDGTMLITSYASNSGFADTNAVNIPYKRKAIHLWEYVKAKTDSLYATKSHNHDGRYVYNYGGTKMDGASINKNALGMATNSGITGDWWHILQAAWNGEYRWNSQIAFPTQNRNGMYYRSGLDDNTKWGSWVKLLDIGNSYVTGGKGVINGTTITQVDNADKVDGYHASSLWRSDGGIWNPSANISLTASGNNQEWSFDIRRNGYTGCYWHVWDSALSTLLKVNADNGKVYAPYNFVGNLEGNAYYATKSEYSRSLLGRSTSGNDYDTNSANLVFAEWNTMSDNRWYLKATGYECRVAYANNAGDASRVYGYVGDTGSHELVRCDMNNDRFRIIAGSNGNNNGWAEIATADDGSEPIYVRQYTGVFSSVVRTLTLLDANGYTHFPSYINIGGNENNNSSPDRVWGSNSNDSYLRSYRTSALRVAYANSANSTTKVIVNQHISNDVNYPLVWSNQANDSSVTENQLFKSWADLYYNPKNKRLYANNLLTGVLQTTDNHYYRFDSDSTLRIYANSNSGSERIYFQAGIDNRIDDYDIPSYGGEQRHSIILNPRGGFVGIGDTNPSYKLSVGGDIGTGGNIYISHSTNNNMNYDTSNPRIVFSEYGTQAVGLVYTDYDSYRPSKGLKVMDVNNDDTSNVWFEVQGYNYSSGYVKNGSNDNYVLLGGGGHKLESALNVANADTVDGYHENSFLRYRGFTGTDQEATLWNQIGIKEYYGALPDGLTDIYNWGGVISLSGTYSRFEIYAAHSASSGTGLYYRSGWDSDKKSWLKFIDSSNIGSQSVNYANSAGNANTATALTTNAGNSINPVYFSGGKPIACTMSTGRGDGIVRSFSRGTYTSANQYFGNGTIVTIDPKGTGCISANDTILSLGDFSNRNTQLLVAWDRDGVYYRRITDSQNYGNWKRLAFTTDNIDSATKLATARTIWGQSFDGTADVNGTIYINNSDSSNGAIRLNNDVNSNARISAIGNQVIFNTGNAIRFGETSWDWNQWAGLKYTHSNKTIYLGIADGSIFNSNSTQGGGTLNLRAGISDIHLNSGTSIIGLPTDGSPYSSSVTFRDASISLSAYGDISMSTGPGAINLSSGYSGIKLSCQGNNASISPEGFKVEASRGAYLNSGNSGNVYLCQGGGKVGISTISPSHELDVMGNTFTTGFGIRPYYLSNSGLLPTISPGDGYTYRCLEIGRSAVVSCIIADRVALSNERGVLIKFNTGFDGQIVLLKDLQNYGDMNGNGYFWVMPSGCKIIRPDGSSTQISYNQISNAYDDGKSRFFVYSYKYDAWIEFYCG